MKQAKIVCLVILLIPMGLYVQEKGVLGSGNQLLKAWENYQKWLNAKDANDVIMTAYDAGLFMGYVTACADAMDDILFDIPGKVTFQQCARIVGKYLEEHPEELHLPAIDLTIKAYEKAFPKKK